jgi:hypothetical protein
MVEIPGRRPGAVGVDRWRQGIGQRRPQGGTLAPGPTRSFHDHLL